jgi:ABC-type thiamin/hydroxymethylpyrimidine transport system permease subunit
MNNNGKNRERPLSAYMIVSHIAFVVAVPLLLFIGGGTWLAERMSWADWTKIVFVLLGVAVMAASLISYLRHLIAQYGTDDPKSALKPSSKERDYYED